MIIANRGNDFSKLLLFIPLSPSQQRLSVHFVSPFILYSFRINIYKIII